MDIAYPLDTTSAGAVSPQPRRQVIPGVSRYMSAAMTGLMLVGAVALILFAYLTLGNGGNGSSGDDPTRFAAAPLATVDPDEEASAMPYPGPEYCVVEPMSREEMIAHIQEANIATRPEFPLYEQAIQPTAEEIDAIIGAYDQWKACGLDTPETGTPYQLRHQSVWYSASSLPVFYSMGDNLRPVSDEQIESYVDGILEYEEAKETPATPDATAATPPMMPERQAPVLVPIPDGATPVAQEGGRAFPVLFADEIRITGPETASATLYWVDEQSRQITAGDMQVIQFVKVDGEWLILDLRTGGLG